MVAKEAIFRQFFAQFYLLIREKLTTTMTKPKSNCKPVIQVVNLAGVGAKFKSIEFIPTF